MDIKLTIDKLEDERDRLCLSKDINSAKIDKYDRLIAYYFTLYTNTLSDISEKKESVDFYEGIIAFKEMISSPKILERISVISDKHLLERISYLEEKIDSLISKSDYLRKRTMKYKEKKIKLEDENARYMDEIGIVDENIKRYRLVRKKAR